MKVHILDTIKLFLLVKYWIKNKSYKKKIVYYYCLLLLDLGFDSWTYNFNFFI